MNNCFQFALLLGFCVLGIAVYPTCTCAQEQNGSGQLVSQVPWDVSLGRLVCTVRQKAGSQNTLATQSFSIYKSKGLEKTRIYEITTLDQVLAVYPLGEYDGRLVTVWTGGSSYHIRVFANIKGHIKETLDTGSRGMPEVVINQNEKESLIVTNMYSQLGTWVRSPKATADIYKWTGDKYVETVAVPWEERLSVASESLR